MPKGRRDPPAVGSDSTATLVRHQVDQDKNPQEENGTPQEEEEENSNSSLDKVDSAKRAGWDNKIQYLLAQVGFAVGLGNVWRFPYLCQKNGGGAFLIPYCIMLVLEGVPLFFMEIAIGQRLRKGSVGVWNQIHPYLGGVGVASMVLWRYNPFGYYWVLVEVYYSSSVIVLFAVEYQFFNNLETTNISTTVCFLIALYYNMIISWALFYFFNSFQSPLPWSDCPKYPNKTESNETDPFRECDKSRTTSYFWYRDTLDISSSISEPGNIEWRMSTVLVVAWFIVFIGIFKGIKSSGKVIYFSATFPYLVLVIYFFRGVTLEGATDGIAYMFTPDMSRLSDPNVWRDAATQIFFSLGLGFGGVIAYSSYNDMHNNCKRDALTVSLINCGTSIFSSVVIFSILGFKAHKNSNDCMDRNIEIIRNFYNKHDPFPELKIVVEHMERDNYFCFLEVVNHTLLNSSSKVPELWKNVTIDDCSTRAELSKAVSGPGLAFIAFTEAIIHMPGGPFWSVLFFSMLINLGLGSMFGTLEGIITPLQDLGLRIPKEAIVAILCLVSLAIGQIFALRSGMYILDIFDTYSGTLPLLMIAFFETIAVSWVYGFKRFSDDIVAMLKEPPGWYWRITWCFVSPLCMIVLFVASIVNIIIETPQYKVYDKETGNGDGKIDYPPLAIAFIVFLIFLSIIWIPIIAFLRWRGYLKNFGMDPTSRSPVKSSDA